MLLQRFARNFKKNVIGTFHIEDQDTSPKSTHLKSHQSRAGIKKKKINHSEISYDSDSDDDHQPHQTKEDIYYYFHKMLSDDSYTLGKHMCEYIESFHI